MLLNYNEAIFLTMMLNREGSYPIDYCALSKKPLRNKLADEKIALLIIQLYIRSDEGLGKVIGKPYTTVAHEGNDKHWDKEKMCSTIIIKDDITVNIKLLKENKKKSLYRKFKDKKNKLVEGVKSGV